MCDTGGPRCTSSARASLESARAYRERVEDRIAAGKISGAQAEELWAKADARLVRAQDDYDVTRGGIEVLEARVAVAGGADQREAWEQRLDWARRERARLMASHRVAGPVEDWRDADWATVGVVDGVEALQRMQGSSSVERAMLDGQVVRSVEEFGGSNTTYRCELDNGQVGYFKPFSGLNHDLAEDPYGQDEPLQPIHEAAAWRLAERLGEPWSRLVAPCIVREVNGELGSFSAESGGRGRQNFHDSRDWRSAAFYDALIGQQDRHRDNFHMDGDRLVLIDHGYAFSREGDYVNRSMLQDYRAGEQLTDFEYGALDRLIASPDLLGLRDVLTCDRADALLARAEAMYEDGRIPSTPYPE